MRRLVLVAPLLLVSCARAPLPTEPARPAPVAPPVQERGALIGHTPNELIGRFGNPSFQVREGNSLKLQFRGRSCVLDAYLYPQRGALRVSHVDSRSAAGNDVNQAACISALEARS
jgi:hypothetical protein